MKKKELSHKGLMPHRRDLYPERIFAELWEQENKRDPAINFGNTALESILNTIPWRERYLSLATPKPVTPISQRDADVAATVIQWLGTSCGKAFLDEAERLIRKEAIKESANHHKKNNQCCG